jgi:hypothetical protein
MQYFITYVLGHLSTSGKKADTGTIVHKVMECLAVLKKYQQDNPNSAGLLVNDEAIGEHSFGKDELLTDILVEHLLDLSFQSYTEKSAHDWTKGDRKTCLNLVWQTLRYNKGQYDPRFRKIVEPEPHFDIPIEEDWAKYTYTDEESGKTLEGQLAIKGTIDLITEVSPDTIEVVDWKTGRRLDWASGEVKDYAKLCEDAQLLLYHYAISKLYPQYQHSIMSIFFVKDGGPFSMAFDRSDHDKFLKMLRVRYEAIKKNDRPRPISFDRSNWKCTKLCHYFKNKWPGTNTSICQHVENTLKDKGMSETLVQLTKPNFSVGHYESPG